MKARLIILKGSICDSHYYGVAVSSDLNKYTGEIILQTSESQYPRKSYEQDGTKQQTGLDPQAEKFFKDIVDKLNSETCMHHYFNGGDCAP